MRRACLSLGLAGLVGLGLVGCGGGAAKDPVAAAVAESGNQYTVSAEAKAGSEGAGQFEKEAMDRQAEADRKARGGR